MRNECNCWPSDAPQGYCPDLILDFEGGDFEGGPFLPRATKVPDR